MPMARAASMMERSIAVPIPVRRCASDVCMDLISPCVGDSRLSALTPTNRLDAGIITSSCYLPDPLPAAG